MQFGQGRTSGSASNSLSLLATPQEQIIVSNCAGTCCPFILLSQHIRHFCMHSVRSNLFLHEPQLISCRSEFSPMLIFSSRHELSKNSRGCNSFEATPALKVVSVQFRRSTLGRSSIGENAGFFTTILKPGINTRTIFACPFVI